MKTTKFLSAVFLALSLYALPSFAVMLDIRNGVLHGANDITVGNALYDVSFKDGTCVDLFNGCDEQSDFFFTNQADALAASTALLDQVFIDIPAGLFDTDPTLANGCDFFGFCTFQTPIGLDTQNQNTFGSVGASNNRLETLDSLLLTGGSSIIGDLTNSNSSTFALWSPSTPVTAPATLYLLFTGLIALGVRRYKMD